jgi:dipeptidase E
MESDLLLLSNSTLHGREYLAHAADAIAEFLAGRRRVCFAPFALADHDGYTRKVRDTLRPFGAEVTGLHEVPDARAAVEQAEVLFVGGGNTFRLLRAIQRARLIEPVRERVLSGDLGYMGSSAGTNHACPTIRTTNDMPIVEPETFEAFALLPFQINPHYIERESGSIHMGETREERILQFLEENEVPVLGMREGAWLRRRRDALHLQGTTGALLFRRGADAVEYAPGADLSFLLTEQPSFG